MSSMLEEAIIDASALKEAAIKNAENVIVEKYSADIKEAVESLLEGPELLNQGAPQEVGATPKAPSEIPLAAMPPDNNMEEEIVLDLDELASLVDTIEAKEESTGEDLMGKPYDPMQAAAAEAPSLETAPPTAVPFALALEEGVELDEEALDLEEALEEDSEEALDLEEVLDIMEELVVDIHPQKEGWAGTPDAVMNYKAEMFLAQKASTASQEELKIQRELVKRLTLENKTLEQTNIKYKKLIIEANSRIEKSNLTNARLLYTNRVMTNDSLNERQKTKIVESVQNAGSIEEAKTIFETLQNAVGGISNRSAPKSLSESIERPVGSLPRRKRESSMETRVVDRMQLLAGIK